MLNDYLKESARTAAGEAHFDNVHPGSLQDDFNAFMADADFLDAAKKSIFYNREYLYEGNEDGEITLDNYFDQDVIHAILGIATESAELVEVLTKPGEEYRAKLMDEAGDCLFYLAMLFRSLNTTFEEVADLNIQKLKVRFPNGFDQDKAIRRDTSKEEAIFKE